MSTTEIFPISWGGLDKGFYGIKAIIVFMIEVSILSHFYTWMKKEEPSDKKLKTQLKDIIH